jgi:RNA polymerase sigma factor (sigma-70 family)
MNEPDQAELLQRYVRHRDEEAFREIVARYIGLVESTALRRVNNHSASARDITQIVFTDLARQADRLGSGPLLGSWLYKHTCFVASKFIRSEQRRLAREKEASQMLTNDTQPDWSELAPLLDSAILELNPDDQNAIVLRFFENRNLRAIGMALNISDDAAQKRVQRALEKLRDALHSKRLTIGVPALSALLLSKGVSPASAATVSALTSAALTAAPPVSFLAATTAIIMSKTAIFIAAICISAIVAIALFHKQQPSAPVASTQNQRQTAQPNSAAPELPLRAAAPAPATTTTSTDEILKALEQGVQGTDEQKIREALWSFWNQYDAATPQEQFQLRRAIPTIIALWKNSSTSMKKMVIGTLERFKPSTDEIVDLYLEAYDTPDLQREALAGIMFAGPLAARATDRLIDQLKGNHGVNDTTPESSSNARMALEALSNFGPPAAAATPILKEFLTDPNMLYRVIGAKAYWNITHDTDTVLPALTKALIEDGSFWAAQILGAMGPAAIPALEELEKAYASSTNPSAQLYAYQAIRQIDRSRAPDPDRLVELLEKGNDISQLHAATLLWNDFKNPDQIIPTLGKLVTQRSSGIPSTQTAPALDLLAEIGPPAESTLPRIRAILEDPIGDSLTWIAATNAWRAIAPNQPLPSK